MIAHLIKADGTIDRADVTAFPNEPRIVEREGTYYAVNDPGFVFRDATESYMEYVEAKPVVLS
jgi:hypothetical protein